MSGLQTILAATDFSSEGRRAAMRAAILAGEHRARLQLLHVLEAEALDELRAQLHVAADLNKALADDAQQQLDEIAREARGVAASEPERLIRTGHVLDEVIAASDGADLLVIGAHGHGSIRDALLGTTAERLLLRSRRPMLAVRQEATLTYRKVLVPVDFSVHSIAALRFALQVAPEAHVQVFHAYQNPYEGKLSQAGVSRENLERFSRESRDQALANLANLIEKAGPTAARVSSSIDHGEPRFLIPTEAAKQGADLVVLGKHGRSRLEEFFLGGTARAAVTRAPCDVLIVPDYPRLAGG